MKITATQEQMKDIGRIVDRIAYIDRVLDSIQPGSRGHLEIHIGFTRFSLDSELNQKDTLISLIKKERAFFIDKLSDKYGVTME
tara:strand:- start:2571 stop:2822 length:252 start_codon:yes stop_codon:yes gene_type:complete